MSLILTCPECATRYVAKTEGFDPPGRNVRCSRCDHMWFQEVSEPESYETLYELYEGEEASTAPDAHARAHNQAQAHAHAHEPDGAPGLRDQSTSSAHGDASSGIRRSFRKSRRRSDRKDRLGAAPTTADRHMGRGSFGRGDGVEQSRLISGLMGLFLTIAILGSLIAGLWYFKPEITRAVPSLAGVYSAIPQPSRPVEFEFRNTAYSRGFEEGKSVLIVSGELVNTTDRMLTIPAIKATLRDGAGEDMDVWVFTPRGSDLGPGESKYFESRRVNPPEDAYGLHLHVIEEG